jgi:hypothetical protein
MFATAKRIEYAEPVWVVGRMADHAAGVWQLQGVFSDRTNAIKACRDEDYFVGPVPLDRSLPHQTVKWPGCFYPIKSAELD